MAELKTKPTKVSVASYVAAIKDPARIKNINTRTAFFILYCVLLE